MKYKYLPHTSEAKFIAYGKNIDEVFRNSALAMFNILGETTKVKPKKELNIKIKAKSYESLLYDFLDELLFLHDTKRIFVHDVKNIKIKDFELTGTVECDDLKNYELKSELKAITYNGMIIRKTKKGYEATVVVDI
ncbi:archease [Candidatus Woesearchaeota archaeon]|nr:archease [Candidatus Woesearchaeota archaeon]